MAKTQSRYYVADGNWICPEGVSAVFLTMAGGGGGSPGAGDRFNYIGASGGAGAGELVVNKLVVVTPGNTYPVEVGTAGTGSFYNVQPGSAGQSSFNGIVALGARGYATPHGNDNSGAGGGAGGSIGFISGGGFDPKGTREARHFTGGAGGGGGSFYSNGAGVLGGPVPATGTGANPPYGGGAGAGTIFGGTAGGNTPGVRAPAAVTSYGGGAGGTGEPAAGLVNGADGCTGYVLLTWSGEYVAPTVPDPPTSPVATAGNTQADIAFTPPADDGGAAISGYTATSTPGGFTGSNAVSPVTVSGLSNGTSYTFTVHATNAVGNSSESAASNSVTPAAVDPYYSQVVLLMHMEGTNGGSTWTDEKGHTGTNTTGTNSTTQVKFGTTSRYNNGGRYVITHADMALGSGDFCVEGWFWTAAAAAKGMFSNANGTSAAAFGMNANATLGIYSNGSQPNSTATISTSTWHHIAYVRFGTLVTLYLDGVGIIGSTDNRNFTQTDMKLGRWYDDTFAWAGYIDDFRITVGQARYTANFTPPAAAFPNA